MSDFNDLHFKCTNAVRIPSRSRSSAHNRKLATEPVCGRESGLIVVSGLARLAPTASMPWEDPLLENHVGPFTPPGQMSWNGLATTCHLATLYWMLTALGHRPRGAADLGGFNIQLLLYTIGISGTRIFPANVQAANVQLPAGSVIVFVDPNLQTAGHSCVLLQNLSVGGYNQIGWFTTLAVNHHYSVHDLGTDLRWVNRTFGANRRVHLPNGNECYLYSTADTIALPIANAART